MICATRYHSCHPPRCPSIHNESGEKVLRFLLEGVRGGGGVGLWVVRIGLPLLLLPPPSIRWQDRKGRRPWPRHSPREMETMMKFSKRDGTY